MDVGYTPKIMRDGATAMTSKNNGRAFMVCAEVKESGNKADKMQFYPPHYPLKKLDHGSSTNENLKLVLLLIPPSVKLILL